eukprot:TRINITY_DN10866_c0_g1_i2.p1 TRINITY_DN10866_c0_g1~~TRINITY_DN10866_c0_g1_i2.p1  ORF type:complete len:356 (+),score=59.23 TRINITY_DN10866_c0_g1_i2:94-1161(+)
MDSFAHASLPPAVLSRISILEEQFLTLSNKVESLGRTSDHHSKCLSELPINDLQRPIHKELNDLSGAVCQALETMQHEVASLKGRLSQMSQEHDDTVEGLGAVAKTMAKSVASAIEQAEQRLNEQLVEHLRSVRGLQQLPSGTTLDPLKEIDALPIFQNGSQHARSDREQSLQQLEQAAIDLQRGRTTTRPPDNAPQIPAGVASNPQSSRPSAVEPCASPRNGSLLVQPGHGPLLIQPGGPHLVPTLGHGVIPGLTAPSAMRSASASGQVVVPLSKAPPRSVTPFSRASLGATVGVNRFASPAPAAAHQAGSYLVNSTSADKPLQPAAIAEGNTSTFSKQGGVPPPSEGAVRVYF